MDQQHEVWMQAALAQARQSYDEGGLPIGAVLVDPRPRNKTLEQQIVARGYNRRVQDNDPTSHGETDCIRKAGRRRDWSELTLVTTLSPCIMCSGTALLLKIPRIIIGENQNFMGAEDLLRERGVEMIHLDHPGCIELLARFQRERPEVWDEDIGE